MADLPADLPDDVRELMAPHLAQTGETLDSISSAIAKRRDEAKTARASSGIEQVWSAAEDAYAGIDDANRSEVKNGKWAKPTSMEGPLSTSVAPRGDHKSTVFVRLTARYVDAGAAKVGEILLPIDDKAFSFTETPVPSLIKAKDDKSHVILDHMGNAPAMRPARPGEVVPDAVPPTAAPPQQTPATALPAGLAAPPGAPPAGPPGQQMVPLTVADLAEEAIELARKKAKAAEKRIYDWMVECQYPAEMRKVIADAARIGVGVSKGPFPRASRAIAVKKAPDGGIDVQIEEKLAPATKRIDPWNFFPDPACGENVHNGEFTLERDYLSERQVRGLKKIPGYIASQIDKVLKEGPDKVNLGRDNDGRGAVETKGRFEIWYYYGALSSDEMACITAASGADPARDPEKKPEEVYAIVTLINDCVIRATINPLDSGEFPYDAVPWLRREGHWAGVGVAEQIVVPQKITNAATRALLNNAGISAGGQIVIDQSAIKPADGQWVITPNKIWYKTGDSAGADVRQAFQIFEIPNVTDQMMKIIQYGMQLGEESTSIPLITQGQSGPTTPDTFGAAQLQNNNANQLLRSIGYAFDDYSTEPQVRRYYEWLLLDPDVPDEEKGDFNINAHGSAALVERAIQDQTIAQLLPLSVQMPALGYDPKRLGALYLKSKRIDPKDVQFTEEEQAKIDAQPPPQAPQVQVATINAQAKAAATAADQAIEGKRIEVEQHKVLTDSTVELHALQLKRELAMLDYANRHQINLDQVKSELTKTAMTLQTQERLNAIDNAIDVHKHHNPPKRDVMKPPTQVPGRAPNGKAFSQAAPS